MASQIQNPVLGIVGMFLCGSASVCDLRQFFTFRGVFQHCETWGVQ